jgi:hypothetical protein
MEEVEEVEEGYWSYFQESRRNRKYSASKSITR